MELSLKINLGENPDQNAVAAFIAAAYHLDKPIILQRFQVGEISSTTISPVNTGTESFLEMAEQAEQQGAEGEGEEASTEEGGTEPQDGAPRRRRGRRSNAQIAADKAAAEALVAATKADLAPEQSPAITLPPGIAVVQPIEQTGNVVAMQSGITLPPGVTQTQSVQSTLAPMPTPVPAAMPVGALPAVVSGEVVPLDVFKATYMEVNTRLPGKPFAALKSTTWPDGSAKQGWFTAEAVPPEHRERLLEIWSTLN